MSDSCCSSEPFSCAAIEQDCTLGLVIQILMARMMLTLMWYFLIVDPKVSYPVKDLLEVYEDIIEILLMLQVFLAQDPEKENICSVVLLPALKSAYSSAVISSVCVWSLFRMIFMGFSSCLD